MLDKFLKKYLEFTAQLWEKNNHIVQENIFKIRINKIYLKVILKIIVEEIKANYKLSLTNIHDYKYLIFQEKIKVLFLNGMYIFRVWIFLTDFTFYIGVFESTSQIIKNAKLTKIFQFLEGKAYDFSLHN